MKIGIALVKKDEKNNKAFLFVKYNKEFEVLKTNNNVSIKAKTLKSNNLKYYT